jgi:hypothetical protein
MALPSQPEILDDYLAIPSLAHIAFVDQDRRKPSSRY